MLNILVKEISIYLDAKFQVCRAHIKPTICYQLISTVSSFREGSKQIVSLVHKTERSLSAPKWEYLADDVLSNFLESYGINKK